MSGVVENIRRIGIFMVAAQAVMYFAPGRQYDKYIKMIAGVMILMQFIRPFVNGSAQIEQEWQEGMEQMMQKLDVQDDSLKEQDQWGNAGTQDAVFGQIEETLVERLNQVNENTKYRVEKVTLQLKDSAEDKMNSAEADWEVESVAVVMEKTNTPDEQENSSTAGPIAIEDITIELEESKQMQTQEGGTEKQSDTEAETYRKLFADTLGIEEDKVEVTCSEGW